MFTDTSLSLSPLWPTWLLGTSAAALGAGLAWATLTLLRKRVPSRWVLVLTVLRLAAVGVFLLLVLGPVLSYRRDVEQRPELLVLVDTSRSMAGPAAAGQGSRLDECLSACRQGDLARALGERFEVHWASFDHTARPLELAALDGLKAEGSSTRLAEGLCGALDAEQAEGRRPGRILLLSDGNDRGGADAAETARRLGVPVDVLAPTVAAVAPAPLRIVDVQSARRVLLGSETHFRLTLRGEPAGVQDRTAVVRLRENGSEVWKESLTLKAAQAEQTFALAHRPVTAGLKQYELQLDSGPREPHRLSVEVVDGKYEVLILEDSWRWEYRFLHRLFEDDPSFRFTAFLARGRGTYAQFGSPDRRVSLVGPPQSRADLEGFDTFFLGDVDPTRWPRGLAASLARLVQDEGKSLVVIAGPSLARFADVPPLHALLPVELSRESGTPVEGPIETRLRPDAAASPFFFQLHGGADRLPPLDRVYPVLRKRPGAAVLVEAASRRNPYGSLIVIAEHTVGRGRVLFVGSDTLWKWHTLAPARSEVTPYSTFWQQACRALTPLRSPAGAVNLWLTPQRSQGEAGQALTIRAEIDSAQPLPGATLRATVTLPDERQLPLLFTAEAADPQHFRATFAPPQEGQTRVSAQLLARGKTMAEATVAVQVKPAQEEEGDVGVDRAALARLAHSSGGRLLDPSRPETWPTADGPARVVAQPTVLDLSSRLLLLVLFCALLGLDWLLRILKGLV